MKRFYASVCMILWKPYKVLHCMQMSTFHLWHPMQYLLCSTKSLNFYPTLPLNVVSPLPQVILSIFLIKEKIGVNLWYLTQAFQCDLPQTHSVLFHIRLTANLLLVDSFLGHIFSAIRGMNLVPDVLPTFSNNGVNIV